MDLKVEKREIFGKNVKSLRRQGVIPAELYGHGVPNLHISLKTSEFDKVYKEAGENVVINLLVDGAVKPVLIYNVDIHPVTDAVQAVDFYEVNMNEEIITSVPLEFVGVPPAVKELGGVLIKAMDEIEVEALPGEIPASITVDLSGLTSLDQSIYVKDLPVIGNYKFTVEPTTVVVSISEPEEEEAQAETELTPDKVIVETEEKKAERDAKEASKTPSKKGANEA